MTLADVTLQHSRDLSALDAARRQALDRVDADRREALHALAAARPALAAFDAACAEAATVRDNAVAQTMTVFDTAQGDARSARAADLIAGQQRYLAADQTSDAAKTAALRKADADYQSRLDDIGRTLSLDKQFAAREAAFDARRRADAAAEAAWLDALRANRDQQQAELQSTLDKERRQLEQAANKRDAAQKAADLVYQATVKLGRTRLTNALAAVPDAAKMQAQYDARRDEVEREFHGREEQLFDAFRDALKHVRG